jgi:hypothetical protein
MIILFLKSTRSPADNDRESDGDEALEKIRAIFVARVKEAKTGEDREAAERELRKIGSEET